MLTRSWQDEDQQLYPPLPTVGTAYPAIPNLAVSHPPVEPAGVGPVLHWSDVDLAARQIVVRHNRVTVNGRVQELTTETRSGRRTVPMSGAGVAALLTGQLRQAGDMEVAQEA